jgi:predicted small metal-binding protein
MLRYERLSALASSWPRLYPSHVGIADRYWAPALIISSRLRKRTGSSAVVAPCFPKEVRMAKTYTCRDVGVDCDWKVGGGDEAEVMPKIRDHARAVHKMDPIPPDLERKVRAAIRDER